MSKVTSYGKTPQSVCNPDGSIIGSGGGSQTAYENHEWATGIVADYDVKAGQSAFGTVATARFVSIRTDAAISVKFNLTTNNSISIAANTSFNVDTLEVTNLYITAVASANVKVFLT
jgi:hypothetical protein